MQARPRLNFSIAADRQATLLALASHTVGYLDAWLEDTQGPNPVPTHRREDIAALITRLEDAIDAVRVAQTVEFV